MHVDSGLVIESPDGEEMEGERDFFRQASGTILCRTGRTSEVWLGTDEIDAILERTFMPTAGISHRAKDIQARAGEAGVLQPIAAR